MKVGIVICAWNCRELFRTSIQSVCSTSDCKILVHDDCSELEQFNDLCEQLPSNIEYYRQNNRNGLTVAWNTGIKWALDNKLDYVVLSNHDVLFVNGWIDKLIANLQVCNALSPLTNSPGVHKGLGLQIQDVRNYVPGFGKYDVIEPTEQNFTCIMDSISNNRIFNFKGIKGFFMGFRLDWLNKNRIKDGEYYSNKRSDANYGVGGSENEIFTRVGYLPWVANNFYIHHFRENGKKGLARQIFDRKYRQYGR